MRTQTSEVTLQTLQKFVVAPTQSTKQVENTLKDIDRQLKTLKDVSRRPKFAFENTPDQIKAERERLEQLRLSAEKEKVRITMAANGYPEELDYTPLGWLKKDSLLPALFIVNIKDQEVSLVVRHEDKVVSSFYLRGEVGFNTHIYPDAISQLYEEAAKRIAIDHGSTWGEEETTATAKFQGILPATTRAKINQALKSRVFDDIFIIAEAKDWSVKTVLIAKDDPYVVGWVKKTCQMFIIDYFDPTPLETYIKEQHTF